MSSDENNHVDEHFGRSPVDHILLWLVLCGADTAAGSFSLDRDQHVIGRTDDCDIRLLHPSVSRRHAILTFDESGLVVRDLGSTNGTFVNGKLVSDAMITIGTLIHFGRVAAEVWDEQPDPTELADDQIETDRSSDDDDTGAMLRIRCFSPLRKRILELLLQGLAEKNAVTQVHVNEHTVHWHIKRIYARLNVHSRAELLARVMRINPDTHAVF